MRLTFISIFLSVLLGCSPSDDGDPAPVDATVSTLDAIPDTSDTSGEQVAVDGSCIRLFEVVNDRAATCGILRLGEHIEGQCADSAEVAACTQAMDSAPCEQIASSMVVSNDCATANYTIQIISPDAAGSPPALDASVGFAFDLPPFDGALAANDANTACMFAGDGVCDEPDLCPVGTDTGDCL